MNTDRLFSALDLAKIDRMQIGFFRQLFLAYAQFLPVFPNCLADDFLMWLPFGHGYNANKKPQKVTHCITFYFFIALF